MKKMHFTRMDQGSDEDFQILKRVHETNLVELPDRLIAMVNDLSADRNTTSTVAATASRPRRARCVTAPTKS